MFKARDQYFTEKFYKTLDASLQEVPERLFGMRFSCGACRASSVIDWTIKRYPSKAVPVYEGDEYKGRWIPESTELECPYCKKLSPFELPSVKWVANYAYFGDEAYRIVRERYEVVCYALLGEAEARKNELLELVRFEKEKFLPEVCPSKWRIHLKTLCDARLRAGSPIFCGKSQVDVLQFINDLCSLMGERGEKLSKYLSIGIFKKKNNPKERKKVTKWVRNRAFNLQLQKVIDDAAMNGIVPKITLESDGRDGWSELLFYGEQCTLLYGYLARGLHIPSPVCEKAQNGVSLLELADVCAYLCARAVVDRMSGKVSETPLALIGNSCFIHFYEGGEAIFERSVDLPGSIGRVGQ